MKLRGYKEFTLSYNNTKLRYLTNEDIEKYIKWHTTQTEWANWDGPWNELETNERRIRNKLIRILRRQKSIIPDRLQIIYKGENIGFVSTYLIDNENQRAVGISIPEQDYWGMGIGENALKLWIGYLLIKTDLDCIYCETWSGNKRMMRLANKCSFYEINRVTNIRYIRGKHYDGILYRVNRYDFVKANINLIKHIKETMVF